MDIQKADVGKFNGTVGMVQPEYIRLPLPGNR